MIVIVMGVVGAGKTTVGRLLAEQLGWQFADADDFHPPSNVEKIRQGISLNDDDRKPWLDSLRTAITAWIADSPRRCIGLFSPEAQLSPGTRSWAGGAVRIPERECGSDRRALALAAWPFRW